MQRCAQLSDSSSDDDDNFEEVPSENSNYFSPSFHQSGGYDLPSPVKRRKPSQSTSSNPINDDESDNLSSISANCESDYGSVSGKRNHRSMSLMSEDSEKNFHDSTHDESIYGNSSLPKFYATPSERGRTISQDFSEKDESNDEGSTRTAQGYFSGASERVRTKSQELSEFESNEEDYMSSTSASDVDVKPSKRRSEDFPSYNPRTSFYGSNQEGVSASKSYESNDEEADKLSATLANISKKQSSSPTKGIKMTENLYIPKTRFSKSSSCDTVQSSSNSDFSSFEGKRKSTDSEEEVNSGPPPKKSKSVAIKTSGAVSKMMEKMGYSSGKGLGKHAQGVVEPVALSSQRGRRGLGHIVEGFEEEDVEWDFDQEKVEVVENVDWLEYYGKDILQLKPPEDLTKRLLEKGLKEELEREKRKTLLGGVQKPCPKKMSLDDETNFCDPKLVKKVIKHKTAFDKLHADEMRKARDRSNPFELIRGGMFLNRAAMKMANMDKRFDFMFTKPVDQNGEPMVGKDELLYFADVCAGPGGFTEYVLWRKKWRAKGFGLTLKASNDFKLDDFYAGPAESFEPHYGAADDGNIYTPANIESFRDLIFEQTDNKGVHFMMADGGFSVAGEENLQEILSKQLYLCQCLVALFVVRTNGHFVTKLFDLFTPFSVGIIYLMYRCFEKICIFKPNTSRPANSERYLVCKWKRSESVIEDIRKYMENVNKLLCNVYGKNEKAKEEAKESKEKVVELDVYEIVLMDIMKSDENFFNYMIKSNNELASRQIVNLKKVVAFVKNPNLLEARQKDLKEQCLKYWEVPDDLRHAPKCPMPSNRLFSLAFGKDSKMPAPTELSKDGDLGSDILKKEFLSIYDWQCVTLQDHEKTTLFYGQGRKRVHKWGSSSWSELPSEHSLLELSPGTLVYGELVYEFIGEGKGLRKSAAFHIIDAYQLGKEVVGNLKYDERYEICQLFCKAMTRRGCPVRMKKLHKLFEVPSLLNEGLVRKQLKNVSIHRLCFPIPPFHHEVTSLLFLSSTANGWCKHWSKSQSKFYYYHGKSKASKYEDHVNMEVFNTFGLTMERLKIWSWKNYVPDCHPPRSVTDKLINFLRANTVHKRT
ncbi:unnamed protein product [Bemisia tabaci]|uniref:Cap-specific mRNA (nucleoside-2'-O-)-methyltransferase 1 n=1 Tax=Bemisia tabaci TaxID=7038 RepID=A0A9P0FAU1_BEMTA|nr:unnamed protein product [Bemisia tabaci]